MKPKLNYIELPDNIIGKMKSLIKQARRNDLEYGFNICEKVSKTVKSGGMIIRNECEGTSCGLKLPKGCPKDEKLVGTYHTHPGGTGIMSESDMYFTCENFSCIGSHSFGKDEISCFVRKPGTNEHDCKEYVRSESFDRKRFLSNYPLIVDKYFNKVYIL